MKTHEGAEQPIILGGGEPANITEDDIIPSGYGREGSRM